MKYFLIAGEASGDLHAARLIDAIKHNDKNATFRFLGGSNMQASAGVEPVVHCRDMAYMGFVEVLRHLKTILGIMKRTKQAISEWKPDAVVLVDYPSFNLKIARFAHALKIPVFYYISPKVWAWKEYRVKQMRKYVDEVYSILPFEPEFFRRHNYEVRYTGNPSVGEIDTALESIPDFAEFCKKHSLDASKPLIALLPGSRLKEIDDNLPVMVKSTYNLADFQTVIAAAPDISEEYYTRTVKREGSYPVPHLVRGDTFALVRNARAALVTSGTATLETALLATPQVACYRMGGSRLLYFLREKLLKVRFVTLPNLITNREVIPELLMHKCNPENVSHMLTPLLQDSPARDAMLDGYAEMRAKLTNENSAENAAIMIITRLRNDLN